MIHAIIVGAGEGKRLYSDVPKAFVKLKNKEIIFWAVEKFNNCAAIDDIIVVVPKNWVEYSEELMKEFNKVSNIVEGGRLRQDSVKAGLNLISEGIILIHDGVRPIITCDFIKKIIDETKTFGTAIPVIPVDETIKVVEKNFINSTIERSKLYCAQTPQGFKYEIIKKAYDYAYFSGFYGTDDAMLVERIGIKVKVIEGLEANKKITKPIDLIICEKLLEE